jgi:pre-mRNA-processing factor 6
MQPNLGDAWAFYYAFELQHGTPQQQRDLVKKCATAKPKYGRYWAPVAKDVKNHRLSTPKLLALTVTQLPSLQ